MSVPTAITNFYAETEPRLERRNKDIAAGF